MTAGRPTKLTPALRDAFCAQLATGATFETAGEAIGISKNSIGSWLAKGRESTRGIYWEFLCAVQRARAEVVQRLLARAQERVKSKADGGSDADPLPLLAVIDRRYAPSVRLTIANELNATLDRLEQEFEHEPEIFERILTAIAEEAGPGAVETSSRTRAREDPRSGSAMGARDALGEAEDLPRP